MAISPAGWWLPGQVACLSDGEAHLALDKEDPFAVQTKPHGHGDVHVLLHSSGLLGRWVAAGVKWVAFFQDTNALVFRGLPAAIGARARNHHPLWFVPWSCKLHPLAISAYLPMTCTHEIQSVENWVTQTQAKATYTQSPMTVGRTK